MHYSTTSYGRRWTTSISLIFFFFSFDCQRYEIYNSITTQLGHIYQSVSSITTFQPSTYGERGENKKFLPSPSIFFLMCKHLNYLLLTDSTVPGKSLNVVRRSPIKSRLDPDFLHPSLSMAQRPKRR